MGARRIAAVLAVCAVLLALSDIIAPMAAMASGGVIVRSSSGSLVFRRGEDDSSGTIVTTGTTTLKLAELQDDGTLKTFDFADNTFKSGAVTTETANMVNRTMNNGTDPTGIWTYNLSTVSGFTRGKIYFVVTSNSLASPPIDRVEFEYGGADGDLALNTSGQVALQSGQNVATVGSLAPPANWNLMTVNGSGQVVASSVQGSVTGSVASVTGSVGSVTGAVGSISGITFPSNFGTFSISGSGLVTLTAAEHTAIAGTDVPSALTAQGYTTARAAKLDNSDVATSTRLATSGYTAAPSASAIVTALLATATPSVPTTGTVGEALSFADTRLDAAVTTRSTKADVHVNVTIPGG